MFFYIRTGLPRVFTVGMLARPALVPSSRIAGKRTRTGLDTFDLVVTAALGSKLSMVHLSSCMALAGRVLSMALLILLRSPTSRYRCARPALCRG